jgi:hypothetical protein
MNYKIKHTTLSFKGKKILSFTPIVFLFLMQSFVVMAQKNGAVATFYLKNETIAGGDRVTYLATHEIVSSETEQFIIEPGAQVTLKAGKRIELLPGFKAEGNFSGTIETPEDIAFDEESFSKVDEHNVSMFPNPSSDAVNILAPYLIRSVKIIDMNGEMIMEEGSINDKAFTMDISGLKNGLYIIEISSQENVKKLRFEKN